MTEDGFKKLMELHEEYLSDVSLNEGNVDEQTLKCPAIKAKWLGILSKYEHNLKCLQKDVKKMEYNEKLAQEGRLKIEVSKEELERFKIELSEKLKNDIEKVEDLRFIVDKLQDYVKLVSFYGNDIKNAIDILKMGA